MKTIPVTQFLRPNGRQIQVETEVQEDEYEKYLELTKLGARLTVEELMSGMVSQCIEHPNAGDFDITISQNNETVTILRRDMLLRFDGEMFDRWYQNMTADDGVEKEDQ